MACENRRSGYQWIQCTCIDNICSKLSVKIELTLKVPEKAVSFSVKEHITTTFETDNENTETWESNSTDYIESLSDTDGEHWSSSDESL